MEEIGKRDMEDEREGEGWDSGLLEGKGKGVVGERTEGRYRGCLGREEWRIVEDGGMGRKEERGGGDGCGMPNTGRYPI